MAKQRRKMIFITCHELKLKTSDSLTSNTLQSKAVKRLENTPIAFNYLLNIFEAYGGVGRVFLLNLSDQFQCDLNWGFI